MKNSQRLGLGIGMDLNWGSPFGFMANEYGSYNLSPKLVHFLKKNLHDFSYLFFSLQPKDFDLLVNPSRWNEYFKAYDEFLMHFPDLKGKLSLHHTFLNLGSMEEEYPRQKIVDFTNAMIERYDLKWINEDLGIWSLMGKSLPYPMPPFLNESGLKSSIENVSFYQRKLNAPLFVEFPGFSEGSNFFIGSMDGFSFYKKLIQETGANAVLDTGHILSYQWLKGNKGKHFLDGLEEALPYDQCLEIHLSGCSIVQDRFLDFHHGVILNEQLEILEFLLKRCPNLKGITFEDPKFTDNGDFIPKSLPNYLKLKDMASAWMVNHGNE